MAGRRGMSIACSGAVGIGLSLEETFQAIAEMGFRELDMLLVTGWAHLGLDELAREYAPAARCVERLLGKYGLAIASANAKYSVRLEDTGAEETQQRQRELDALLRFLKDFGAGRGSVQPTLTDDVDYLARTYPDFVRELVRQQDYAAERGVMLSLEPHIRSAVCTNEALHRLLDAHPGLHITYDPSHLLFGGEPMDSTGYLFPHTTLVHLRDARPNELFVPWGHGGLDLPFVMDGLKQAGYNGPVVLEYLSDRCDGGVREDLALFAQAVRRSSGA